MVIKKIRMGIFKGDFKKIPSFLSNCLISQIPPTKDIIISTTVFLVIVKVVGSSPGIKNQGSKKKQD